MILLIFEENTFLSKKIVEKKSDEKISIGGIPVKKAPPFAGRYLIGGAFLYSIFGPPKIDQIRPKIDLFSAAGEKFWRLRRANAPETRFLHDFPFVEHQKPQNFPPAAG